MFLGAAGEILIMIRRPGEPAVFFGAVWVDADDLAALIRGVGASYYVATGVAILLMSRYGFWMFGALTAIGVVCMVVWWTHGRAVLTGHGREPIGWGWACYEVVWYILALSWCWFRRGAFKPSVKK
jgi:hypothetical protein